MDILPTLYIGCVGTGNLCFYFIDQWIKRNYIQNLNTP